MIWIGTIVSWLLVITSGIKIGIGLLLAFGASEPDRTLAARTYLGSGTIGEELDQASIVLAAGLVIGLLAKIARNSS